MRGFINMYQETYEEYIRNILGYPNYNNNIYENSYNTGEYRNQEQDLELEMSYPEIYKVVYPMIEKACSDNVKPVNAQLVEELTNEIYSSIETNNREASKDNKELNSFNREPRREDRQFRNNSGLQDLIKILLIRELLRKTR